MALSLEDGLAREQEAHRNLALRVVQGVQVVLEGESGDQGGTERRYRGYRHATESGPVPPVTPWDADFSYEQPQYHLYPLPFLVGNETAEHLQEPCPE
jgi:hypothetical protein